MEKIRFEDLDIMTLVMLKKMIGDAVISPALDIETVEIEGGHRVIITSGSVTKSFDVMDGVTKYDELEDLPISNIKSTAEDPIDLAEVESGIYKADGTYTIGDIIIEDPNKNALVSVSKESGIIQINDPDQDGILVYKKNEQGVWEKTSIEAQEEITDQEIIDAFNN